MLQGPGAEGERGVPQGGMFPSNKEAFHNEKIVIAPQMIEKLLAEEDWCPVERVCRGQEGADPALGARQGCGCRSAQGRELHKSSCSSERGILTSPAILQSQAFESLETYGVSPDGMGFILQKCRKL